MFENFDWDVVGPVSLACLVCLFILVLWRRREKRRVAAGEASGIFKAWGLTDIGNLLAAYEIGNYLGKDSIFRCFKVIVKRVREEGLPAMMENAFWQMLRNHHLKTAAGRAKVADELRKAEAIAAIDAEKLKSEPDLPLAAAEAGE